MYEVWEFEPGDVSRDLSFVKKGKFGRKDQRGSVGDCIGFVEVVFSFLCAYDGCNLTTLIVRLLEQIGVSRMVDIDILIQIWKNHVKKIDFVLKWLSRVGSEVGPTKGGRSCDIVYCRESPSFDKCYGFTSWLRTCTTSSIVPAFLGSTSCGMTSARGHGAIAYCLNSGSGERQTGRHNSKVEPAPY
ncbi:uncharacterized protein TNCV_4757961 [Trichonephila clavipes]|nr:uncharacterized protein TNCV_4757961 [Trichonephila clavipes]